MAKRTKAENQLISDVLDALDTVYGGTLGIQATCTEVIVAVSVLVKRSPSDVRPIILMLLADNTISLCS